MKPVIIIVSESYSNTSNTFDMTFYDLELDYVDYYCFVAINLPFEVLIMKI